MLNRESILKAEDLKTVDVDVPEWGGSVRIATMTGRGRQEYFQAIAAKGDESRKDLYATRIVSCAVDDAGAPLFKISDIPELTKKSSVPLNRLFEAAAELNGLTQKAVDDIAGE